MEMEKDLRLYYELVERMVVMKKKLFAVIAAAMTGLCCLAAPVSAEQTCKMGDVNMDGEIDLGDAQLALKEYTVCTLGQKEHWLPEEQIGLAMVADRSKLVIDPEQDYLHRASDYFKDHVSLNDANAILQYFGLASAYPSMPDELDVVTFAKDISGYRRAYQLHT